MFLLQKPEIEWRSDWRKETEAWIAAHKGERRLVTAIQIKERQERPDTRTSRHGNRKCDMCDTVIRKDNRTGRCAQHKPSNNPSAHKREIVRNCMRKRRARLKSEGLCVDCGKGPAKENRTLCQKCLDQRSRSEMDRTIRLCAA